MDTQAIVAVTLPSADEGDTESLPWTLSRTESNQGVRTAPLCFAARGFSLHAATRVEGRDRRGLEQLCRYVIRPPLAAGRGALSRADL